MTFDDEAKLNECFNLLNGQSDEHRFVGLLMITKYIKDSDSIRIRIFDALGNRFIIRLLISDDGDAISAYQSLGISLLASFSQDKAILVNLEDKQIFLLVIDILKKCKTMNLLMDCLSFFCAFKLSETSNQIFLQCNMIKITLDCLICSFSKDNNKDNLLTLVFSFLKNLCVEEPLNLNNIEKKHLEYLAKCCLIEKSALKLDYLDFVLFYFKSSKTSVNFISVPVLEDLKETCYNLLTSRLSEVLRDKALELLGYVLQHNTERDPLFFLRLTSQSKDYDGENFICLFTSLYSIEIKLLLDQASQIVTESNYEVKPDSEERMLKMLVVCYYGIEEIIRSLVLCWGNYLSYECILKIEKTLNEAMLVVVEFLTQCLSVKNNKIDILDSLIVASCRLLGCWLSEDPEALGNDFIELLLLIIEFNENKSSEIDNSITDLDSDDEINSIDFDKEKEMDIVRFLLPCLYLLTTKHDFVGILIKKNVLNHLLKFTQRHCSSFTSNTYQTMELNKYFGILHNIFDIKPNEFYNTIQNMKIKSFKSLLLHLVQDILEGLDTQQSDDSIVLLGNLTSFFFILANSSNQEVETNSAFCQSADIVLNYISNNSELSDLQDRLSLLSVVKTRNLY